MGYNDHECVNTEGFTPAIGDYDYGRFALSASEKEIKQSLRNEP